MNKLDAGEQSRYANQLRYFQRRVEDNLEQAALPLKEKVRILLELQKQELPLLARQRPLRPWEKPWPIEP